MMDVCDASPDMPQQSSPACQSVEKLPASALAGLLERITCLSSPPVGSSPSAEPHRLVYSVPQGRICDLIVSIPVVNWVNGRRARHRAAKSWRALFLDTGCAGGTSASTSFRVDLFAAHLGRNVGRMVRRLP